MELFSHEIFLAPFLGADLVGLKFSQLAQLRCSLVSFFVLLLFSNFFHLFCSKSIASSKRDRRINHPTTCESDVSKASSLGSQSSSGAVVLRSGCEEPRKQSKANHQMTEWQACSSSVPGSNRCLHDWARVPHRVVPWNGSSRISVTGRRTNGQHPWVQILPIVDIPLVGLRLTVDGSSTTVNQWIAVDRRSCTII